MVVVWGTMYIYVYVGERPVVEESSRGIVGVNDAASRSFSGCGPMALVDVAVVGRGGANAREDEEPGGRPWYWMDDVYGRSFGSAVSVEGEANMARENLGCGSGVGQRYDWG